MLCGSIPACGCSMSTLTATAGGMTGSFPTITVAGAGSTVSPWSMSLDTTWAGKVVAAAQALVATPWTGLTFTAPWVNYGSVYQTGQFRKIGNDIVYLRGLVAGGASVTGSAAFTLPVGFRPSSRVQFPIDHNGNSAGAVTIDTAGVGNIYWISGDGTYASLTGIWFSVTA